MERSSDESGSETNKQHMFEDECETLVPSFSEPTTPTSNSVERSPFHRSRDDWKRILSFALVALVLLSAVVIGLSVGLVRRKSSSTTTTGDEQSSVGNIEGVTNNASSSPSANDTNSTTRQPSLTPTTVGSIGVVVASITFLRVRTLTLPLLLFSLSIQPRPRLLAHLLAFLPWRLLVFLP